jgi:UDP-N-acetylmuramate dehydrogenase
MKNQYKLIDFAKYSSIKIGSKIEVEIIDNLNQASSLGQNRLIIGNANNLLVSPTPPPLCMLGKEFNYIKIVDDRLVIGGATKSRKIYQFCKRNDIKGFEFLSKLPGTLGGLVKMNAGLKSYTIFDNLISIKTFEDDILSDIPKSNIDYGYRYCNLSHTNSIIFEATFVLEKGFDKKIDDEIKSMRSNQPKLSEFPSAGSAFKNPNNDYAGRLIEEVGLKGYQKGGAMFSDIHANFLVNVGNATFEDAVYLINEAKRRVKEEFNIELEEEIKII